MAENRFGLSGPRTIQQTPSVPVCASPFNTPSSLWCRPAGMDITMTEGNAVDIGPAQINSGPVIHIPAHNLPPCLSVMASTASLSDSLPDGAAKGPCPNTTTCSGNVDNRLRLPEARQQRPRLRLRGNAPGRTSCCQRKTTKHRRTATDEPSPRSGS